MIELVISAIIVLASFLGIYSLRNASKVKYNNSNYLRNERIELCKNNESKCDIFYR